MLLWRGLSLLCTVEGGASAVPKPSCIQFSILKNACQPQLLSLKIGKKSLKIGKSETLENHFSFSMTFWQKSLFWAIFWIAFQYYVECTSWDFFSCPGRMFSYCVRARAYTHVLARVYSTRASTCTIYTCFTLPPTRVNPTGLQLSIFQQFWSFVTNIRTSMLPNKFYGRAQPNWDNFDFDFDNCGSYFWKSWPCLICLQFIYLQTDHVMPPSLDFERE